MDVLFLGGNEYDFHQFDQLGPHIEKLLEAAGIAVTATTEKDDLLGLVEYDVFVDYTTNNERTDAQRDALLSFVRGGGGYAGIHCAADLTMAVEEPDPEMEALIGGRFITHPENSEFPVEITADHPITEGVENFSVYDEPYQLEYGDVDVLARMDHPELDDMPVAWINAYGDGPVFYCSLGHTEAALTHDAVRRLIAQGVQWAGGEL